MIKLESITSENIITPNKLGFSYEFNKKNVTCLYSENQSKIIDLYNIISGFEKPKSGKIFINEFCYNDLSSYQKTLVFCKTTAVVDTISTQEHYFTVNQNIARYLKMLNKNKKEVKDGISEAATLFNLTNILNKKIINLTSEEKILYMVAKAFATHNKNIIIDINDDLIFSNHLQFFLLKQIEKLKYQNAEILVMTSNKEFANNFIDIIDLNEIDKKEFILDNLLVENVVNLKKIHYHPKNYFYAVWIFLSSNISLITISWIFAIMCLFSCFLLGGFVTDKKIDEKAFILLIVVTVFFCILLISFFIIIILKIYRKNQKQLNYYQSINVPRQIIFSILPTITAIYLISSIIIALMLYLCFAPMIFDLADFDWAEIWITVVIYFLIFMFTSLIASLSLLNKTK